MAKKLTKKRKKLARKPLRRFNRASSDSVENPRLRRDLTKSKSSKITKKLVDTQNFDFVRRTKIRIVGIGGGGCSIVSELAQRIKRASFVAANTDSQALKLVGRRVIRFQFGQSLTQGLGTGMKCELAALAAQNEKEQIKKFFTGQDLCVIIACLGGGTGSGAIPVFAKIARKLGHISYGIFTLPFKFEGEKKAQIAAEALEKLRPHLNAISIIPNDRIFQTVEKNTPLKIALSTINKKLAESLGALLETIYEPGLINIDFADLKTIFEGRGRLTYLNSVEVSNSEKNEDLIKKVLYSPLYPYTIRGAKRILFNIVGGKNLELSEVSRISKSISDSVNREAKIIFGITQKNTPYFKQKEGKIKITLLATGCGQRIFSEKKSEKSEKISRKSKVSSWAGKKPRKVKKKIIQRKIKPSTRAKLGAGKIKKKPQPPKQKRKKGKGKKTKTKRASIKPVSKREVEEKKISPLSNQKKIEINPVRKITVRNVATEFSNGTRVRRNALELKKDIETEEKELIAEENKWETPAFLRKKGGFFKEKKKNYE